MNILLEKCGKQSSLCVSFHVIDEISPLSTVAKKLTDHKDNDNPTSVELHYALFEWITNLLFFVTNDTKYTSNKIRRNGRAGVSSAIWP